MRVIRVNINLEQRFENMQITLKNNMLLEFDKIGLSCQNKVYKEQLHKKVIYLCSKVKLYNLWNIFKLLKIRFKKKGED